VKLRRAKSTQLLERLAKVESPDVTFLGDGFPVVMKKARGMVVTDADDNRYLDFTACFGVLAFGHGSAVVREAIRRQSAKLIHGMGDVHPTREKVRLLEALAATAPFPNAKITLGLSGSDAIDTAIKTAMVATGRSRFLSFSGGYHGLTLGPLSLNSRAHFRSGFEPWIAEKCTVLPFPQSAVKKEFLCAKEAPTDAQNNARGLFSPEQTLALLKNELAKNTSAAIVFEPLQGRAGEREWPVGFLKEMQSLAQKHGTLLIADEIFSGLGRTGSLWAHTNDTVVPNIICAGKALGGGLPLSACIADCMDAWGKSTGEARHTSTFLGHPLACAVGYDVLKQIHQSLPDIAQRTLLINTELQMFVQNCLATDIPQKHPFVVRGRGYMRGLWFFKSAPGFAVTLSEQLMAKGFLTLPSGEHGDVLSLTPPLIATPEHFRKILKEILGLLSAL
jgi:4-aminobutyrate aminotransferase-like enzyme